jgi:poly(3-hydroxybutyrate) depolymerase
MNYCIEWKNCKICPSYTPIFIQDSTVHRPVGLDLHLTPIQCLPMAFQKIALLLWAFLYGQHLFAQIDYKGLPQWSWHKEDSTEYYLYTPSGMSTGEKYPIALVMHGCCGDSYHATLRNTVDPPVRMWHNFGANSQQVPTYIIAPATSRGWVQHFTNLKKVMDELVANHNGDPQRIYVSGFSMGGEGTFRIIQQFPNYFAAAIPMGMSFQGDSVIIKDVPIWANQGETDWWARTLKRTVAGIRRLNGHLNDTGSVQVTGVNPRYSSFPGVDHGVQWIAASTQDLTGWAYSKINDGNKYPTVFFRSPAYGQVIKNGETVTIDISASDFDGSIIKTEILINGIPYKTLLKQPFSVLFKPGDGDTRIEAVVTDNKGKKMNAITLVKVDEKTKIITPELAYGRQGACYATRFQAMGNGPITYSLEAGSLPAGCTLLSNGWIKGIPEEKGLFNFTVKATDEDRDFSTQSFALLIKEKRIGEIIVRNAITDSGTVCEISKIKKGETLFTGAGNDEISFSETGRYDGLTLIKTPVSDTSRSEQDYLSFETDQDAIVYIGYEKKDRLMSSAVPAWLKDFTHQPAPQVVAQYFYFDIYGKKFPKGKIILPGADEKRNNASTNYFVLVKNVKGSVSSKPEISSRKLSVARAGRSFQEHLTILYGHGAIKAKIVKGALSPGLKLSTSGTITGVPQKKGAFSFTIEVTDQNGEIAFADLNMQVN